MLSGQLTDGFTTPLVGILSDRFNTPCGKRTPWYIFGSILVVPSFFLLFYNALPEDASESTKNAYFITLPALFNVGWACVQISNMSIVNQITYSQQ
jgi:GPH family glycoside/pentoside/hexuronide:cation symporter